MADGNLDLLTFLFRVNGKADEGHLLSWNEKCEEVLGHAKADVVGQVWHSRIVAQDYVPLVLDRLEEIRKAGIGELVIPLVAASGQRCCALMYATARPRTVTLLCLARTPLGPGPLGVGDSVTDFASVWPISIQSVPGCGLAMIAARDLPAGRLVIEEEPFYVRLKPSAMEGRPEWDADWARAFSDICEPLHLPGSDRSEETPLLASAALVRNAIGFAQASTPVKQGIWSLHSPPLDMDHALVKVAGRVAKLCKARLEECKGIEESVLQTAILATELNTFEGGRVFNYLCRANHSCAPNALFISMRGKGSFKTLRPVRKGEQLTISYLGSELVYASELRRRLLWRTKCFICQCPRCAADADLLRDRPCTSCSQTSVDKQWRVAESQGLSCRAEPSLEAKVVGRLEREALVKATGRTRTTSEGDWVELEAGWVLNCGWHPKLQLPHALVRPRKQVAGSPSLLKRFTTGLTVAFGHQDVLPASNGWYSREGFEDLQLPECARAADHGAHRGAGDSGVVQFMQFQGGRWRCSRCGQEEASKELLQVERALAQAAQRVFIMDLTAHRVKGTVSGPTKDITFVSASFVQQALRLADDALMLLGRRHWIWQLGVLFAIDLDLSLMKYAGSRFRLDATYVSYVVGMISSLLEMWDWLSSVGLSADPACWLYTRADKLLHLLPKTGDATLDSCLEALQQRVSTAEVVADTLGSREFLPQGLATSLAC